jgi:hypothetical protein
MSQNYNPRCCSECLLFDPSPDDASGKCGAYLPWYIENRDTTIQLPEFKADECDCFLPPAKPWL